MSKLEDGQPMRVSKVCRPLTNHTHVRKNGEDVAPAQTTKLSPSLEQTTRGVREESSHKFEEQSADNLNKRHGAHTQTLEQEVGYVEVGGLGQILGQKVFR